MNAQITRWTPQDVFRNRFDRLFDNALTDFFGNGRSSEEVRSNAWLPPVDVRETDDSLTVAMDLPGMSRDDVEIVVEDRTLTVRGERKFEKDVERESYHRMERLYGSFSRSFTLPANVQTDDVKAHFDSGVLNLELPKVEESKPRKIEIS